MSIRITATSAVEARVTMSGVLLVARRVGDDELPTVGRKKRYATSIRSPAHARRRARRPEREVDVTALGPHLLGVAPQRRDLILEDQLCLEQHPPDQC